MRLLGYAFVLLGLGLEFVSWNLETLVLTFGGSLDDLHDKAAPFDVMRYAVVGGFLFVGGAVMVGCAALETHLKKRFPLPEE